MGKIMTLDVPPEDPTSDEGWEECPRCKGTGVEMAAGRFEVSFRFPTEDQARRLIERITREPDVPACDIRPVEAGNGLLDDLFDGLIEDNRFEVFVGFDDEVEAREFMERIADEPDVHSYGIRRV